MIPLVYIICVPIVSYIIYKYICNYLVPVPKASGFNIVKIMFLFIPAIIFTAYLTSNEFSSWAYGILVLAFVLIFLQKIFLQAKFKYNLMIVILVLILIIWPLYMIKPIFLGGYKVKSFVMHPTLPNSARIVYNPLSYYIKIPYTNNIIANIETPTRGDLIMLSNPGLNDISWFDIFLERFSFGSIVPNKKINFIPYYPTRIVGIPGDLITIENRELKINYDPLPRVYKASYQQDINGRNINYNIFIEENNGYEYDIQFLTYNYDSGHSINIRVPKKGDLFLYTDKESVGKYEFYINDFKISNKDYEKYIKKLIPEKKVSNINNKQYTTYTFNNNYYFVMNDNRDDGDMTDSRVYGVISSDLLVGKVQFIYAPTKYANIPK